MNKGKFKPYPKYKKSGVEWIGEVPEGWEEKKFWVLFSFSKGLGITKEDLQDKGVPCVNYGEIHSKYGFDVDPQRDELKCVDEKYLKTSTSALLKCGDFIFADTSEDIEGSGNFTYLNSNVPTFAGYHTVIARPIKENVHRYIAYLFSCIPFRTQIRSEVAGIKVYSITKTILRDLLVSLPPLPEQKAIAEFLDRETERINGIVEKQTRMIELLKEKRSALITKAVTKGLDPDAKMKPSGVEWIGEVPEGWQVRKIKYTSPIKKKKLADSDYKIALENVESFTGRYIESEVPFDGEGIAFEETSILYGKLRPYLCKVFLPEREGLCVSEFLVMEPDGDLSHRKYLFYYYLSSLFTDVINGATFGSKMPRADWRTVGNFKLFLPPLPEQKAIAEYLDRETTKIDNLIAIIEKQIELLNEYKQSLITNAVTGKIDVREAV